MLAPRPDPARLLVPGGGGAAVLARGAREPRRQPRADDRPRLLAGPDAGRCSASSCARSAGRRPTSRSRTRCRRSAWATSSCSCSALRPRRATSGWRSRSILVGYWAAFALYPAAPAGFDCDAVGVPAGLAAALRPASPPTGTRTPTRRPVRPLVPEPVPARGAVSSTTAAATRRSASSRRSAP